MKKHRKYFSYVLRHKWYVFLACCKLGIPWQGITHDLSKFRPSEWRTYAEYFYGTKKEREWFDIYSATGGIPELAPWGAFIKDHFNLSWLNHQHRNPHHWQYWVLREDSGAVFPLPMPDKYRKEMLADWEGAGKAQGKPDTAQWFLKNGLKMLLYPDTRRWLGEQLRVQDELDIGAADYDRTSTACGSPYQEEYEEKLVRENARKRKG